MSETKPKPYDAAPWPKTAEEVTADKLARHYLLGAQVHIGSLDGFPTSSRQWHDAIAALCINYAAGFLLRKFAEADPDAAHAAAGQLFSDLQDGGSVHEAVWEWLTESGLDPDSIAADGKRLAELQMAQDAVQS